MLGTLTAKLFILAGISFDMTLATTRTGSNNLITFYFNLKLVA